MAHPEPVSHAALQAPLAQGMARRFFATAALATLASLPVVAWLPQGVPPALRATLAALYLAYVAHCAVEARLSLRRAAYRVDAGLFRASVGALLLVGCTSVALQTGLHNPGLGLGPVMVCLLFASTRWRYGLALAGLDAVLVAALAAAEWRGLLPAQAGRTVPLAFMLLVHGLVIGCAVAGGTLIGRVLDHYLRASAEREQRFRSLLAIAADRYWEMDAQFRFSHFSAGTGGLAGGALDRWLGRTPWEMGDVSIHPRRLDAHRADLEAHRVFKDMLVRTADGRGRSLHVSVSGEPRHDAAGLFIGYWGVARDVTAERRAHKAVAASEGRYRELFERSPSPVLLHRRGAVVDANPAAARMFGYPDAGTMRGANLVERYAPGEQRERALQRMARFDYLPTGEGLPVTEQQLQSVDGRTVHVQATGVRVATAHGMAVLEIYHDITARKAAETALRRSEAMLSHLIATSPDCTTLTDLASGRYALVNDSFVRISGYSREEAIGRTSLELGIWASAQERLAFVTAVARDGGVQDLPVTYLRRDRSRVAMLASAAAFDFEGRRMLVINARDVTARERTRMEVEAILNTVSLAIAFARDGRIVRINTRYQQMFGWSAEELDRATLATLWADPAEYQAFRRAAGSALRTGRRYEAECQMRRRDDSLLWCRMQAQSVDPGDPIGGGTIWSVEDITERRHFEQTLAAARDAAEAASRAKSAFLANTSHEIRTPLNGLLGLARLALQDGLPEARRRQYLHQIHDSTLALSGIMSDILDLSKVEAGKITLEAVPFDLHEALVAVHHAYQSLAEAKELQLTLHIAAQLPVHVSGDPGRVRQILSNFITNALKFTEHGSVRIDAAPLPGGRVRLAVVDTGPGIAADTQLRLFMPFSQADESTTRRYGGTGLGLSISRELARLMGGDVGVDSAPGQGSRFWAELPLPPAEAAPAGRETSADQAERLRGMHVLMVEDNPVNMMIAVATLEQWGVQVGQANDGAQAVEAVRRAALDGPPFDAVLMDVHMPVMSGHAAARALRLSFDAATLPVIALTAAALVSEREEALAAGMNDFLTKPLDADKLRQALLRHVRPRAAA